MQLPSAPGLARIPGLRTGRPGLAGLATLVGLAALIRERLSRRGDTVAPGPAAPGAAAEPARPPDLAIVAAAGLFAPTSYARARLLRQLHASGLLTQDEAVQAEPLFGVAQ